MKLVIFGLTVSSAWANGHATTWRGLLKGLHQDGHEVIFFERDVPYYADNRDLPDPDFCELVLYPDWDSVLPKARAALADADVALVTSYCADGLAACQMVLDSSALRVFYDLDTPVTLAALAQHGLAIPEGARYLSADLIPEFDLYLSFTGGPLLDEIIERWGARRSAPLYCGVDPELHHPVQPLADFRCALGYLGTYAPDRQPGLEALLIEPARRRPQDRFFVVGSMYPQGIDWPANVWMRWHLDPGEHAGFYCASRMTLNITRAAMRETGYSPSPRLFEAASCGTPILSDPWPGIESFFTPGSEILLAQDIDEACELLEISDAELARVAKAARERTLAEHTGLHRARELVARCEELITAMPGASWQAASHQKAGRQPA
ncbi:CgeB family protein [Thermithiobacillus plumbiphilus]|uniref:Glycosyltransferase n=1 Tax=Thermithiobacillus plumbiphilus TaxID=1729899 RepID=A0ABU9DCR7_9PROT